MVAVSIVLGLLSAAGFLVSLLALIYPFGRFRTRGRALKAAALCVVSFVLSPVLGAVGAVTQAEIARTETTGPAEASAGPAGARSSTEAVLAAAEKPVATGEASADALEPSAASLDAPSTAEDRPPADSTTAATGEDRPDGVEVTPRADGATARAEAAQRPAPTLSSHKLEQLSSQALWGEWNELRAEIERLREGGFDLAPAATELESLMLKIVAPIPASEATRDLEGYRVLATLRPDDPAYAEKVAQYEAASAQRAETLLASLRVEEDRIEGVTWYHHPHEPRYWDQRSLVWLAIAVPRRGPPQLVMHTHYTADRWLFVHEVKAYHHGYAEVLTRGEFEGDHDTEIWEWRKEVPTEHQLWMLQNLARAPDAALRFEGQRYHDDVTLSAADKQLILDMLEAFAILSEG